LFKLKRHEILLIAALLIGLILGKLIKNFKWGMMIGIVLVTLYAFALPRRKSNNRRN